MSVTVNHLIRTNHHDTGALDLFCGETRGHATDEIPGAPVCTNCIVAALESSNSRTDKAIDALAEVARSVDESNMRKVIGWVDDITLRLERLERKAAKKGGTR